MQQPFTFHNTESMISNICWEQTYPLLDFELPHKERLTRRRLKDIGNGRECVTQGNLLITRCDIISKSLRDRFETRGRG